jgi:uncharacterized membrane protein
VTLAETTIREAVAPRRLILALLASLALNLVVIGATAGFVWRHSAALQAANAKHPSRSLLNYASTLPPARHKELADLTKEQRRQVWPLRRHLREVREEAVQALTATPFDKARFDAAAARLLVADRQAREAVYRLYAAIAANMTPEERRGYAEWREQRRRLRNPLDEPEKQANGSPR